MNHNIVVRNERIQKVSLSLPVLPSETIIVNDVTNALEHLSGHRWMILSNNQIVGSSVPERLNEDQKFDAAVVRISPNKDRLRVMLSMLNGVLSESAVVWLLGSNDEGIKSLPKTAEDFIQTVETIDIRHRARLLKGRSSNVVRTLTDWISVETISIGDQQFEWSVMPGVFAKGRLDAGTEFLLEVLSSYPFKRTHQLADFACGTGVIARWLSERFPEAHIDATDADSWSIELTRRNAPKAHSVVADGWAGIPRDRRYDVIVSNPPVHTGKESDFSILEGLLRGAKERLHYRGQIIMVVQHHVPLEQLALKAEYRICEVVQHNNSYKVWRVGMRR